MRVMAGRALNLEQFIQLELWIPGGEDLVELSVGSQSFGGRPKQIDEVGAQIGKDVEIGPYSVIGAHVVIGDGCKIHHQVSIDGYTTLGEQCEVFPQAVLGSAPQDVKYSGEKTRLDIGKKNIFREKAMMLY